MTKMKEFLKTCETVDLYCFTYFYLIFLISMGNFGCSFWLSWEIIFHWSTPFESSFLRSRSCLLLRDCLSNTCFESSIRATRFFRCRGCPLLGMSVLALYYFNIELWLPARILELGSIAISRTIKSSVINALSLNRKLCMGISLITLA